MRQAAILVGGMGSRLGEATAATPKPILPCGDRPFLAWLIRELARFGVTEVVLLTGYLSSVLEATLPAILERVPRGVTVTCSQEPVRAGTGGALYHARELLHDRFLLCNGDSILDCNLSSLLADAAANPAPGRLVLRQVDDTDRYGVVAVAEDRIVAFRPRAPIPGPGLINAGIYLLGRAMVSRLSPTCSLEADVLPALAQAGELRATIADGFFIDIGIPSDLERAQTAIPAQFHRPALFLDRNGTILREHGRIGAVDPWEWSDGAREGIAAATNAGWHVFVVTSQSELARGSYDQGAATTLDGVMEDEVRRAGGTVDDICEAAPGMIVDLVTRWEVDPARCIFVSDRPGGMAAAAAAGMTGHLFRGGSLQHAVERVLA